MSVSIWDQSSTNWEKGGGNSFKIAWLAATETNKCV